MRYGIFSDIHSNLEALEAVVEAFKEESIDRYLCVGDMVGYAANPIECIQIVSALAIVIVAGNHDWAAVDLLTIDYFNPQAARAILWTKDKLDEKNNYFLESLKLTYQNKDLTLVHGTLDEPETFDYLADSYTAQRTFQLLKTDICFVGHTHVAGVFIQDKDGSLQYRLDNLIKIEDNMRYIVNVGSVGQPRDNNPKAAYCIYDTEKSQITIKRIDYDRETTGNKIIDAGLPKSFGDRLLVGR